jgi:hypothetical protein
MQNRVNYKIPTVSDDVFLFRNDKIYNIMNEGATTYELDRIDYTYGINTYVKGVSFPRKGFPTPEAVWENNILKRLLVIILKTPVVLLTKKRKIKLVNDIADLGFKVMEHNFFKLHYLTPTAQELHIITKYILQLNGFSSAQAYRAAVVFSHLIEYDNAYRYRLQDILSETTKEKLTAKPITEIRRLMKLMKERDDISIFNKFKKFSFLFTLALLLPKYRKMFRQAVSYLDLTRLQFDEADRYWVSLRNDYKFFGKSFEERYNTLKVKPQGLQLKYE